MNHIGNGSRSTLDGRRFQLGSNVCVFAPPGYDCTAWCRDLARRFGLLHLTIDELVDRALDGETTFSSELREYVGRMEDAPLDLVCRLVRVTMRSRKGGFLFNGFPASCRELQYMIHTNIKVGYVFALSASDNWLLHRVIGRRLDPLTLEEYHMESAPPPWEALPRLTVLPENTEREFQVVLDEFRAGARDMSALCQRHGIPFRSVDVMGSLEGARNYMEFELGALSIRQHAELQTSSCVIS